MIADDIAATLPRLRDEAKSLMLDTITVERANGTTLDPVTLQEVESYAPVWSGAAKYRRTTQSGANDSTVAGSEFIARTVEVCIPWDQSAAIREGDRVSLASSPVPRHEEPLTVRAVSVPTHPVQAVLVCERAVRDER